MNIPIFKKPSSFILFIGLGIGLYIINFNIKSEENIEHKRDNGAIKMLELQYEITLDSAECSILAYKYKALMKNNDTLFNENIYHTKLLLIKKEILNKKRNKEIELIKSDIDETSEQLKIDSGIYALIGLLVAGFYVILGIYFLFEEYELKKLVIGNESKNKNNYNSKQSLKNYLQKKRSNNKI
jgi:hypothetical protein